MFKCQIAPGVTYAYIAVWALQHLVHALRPQRGLQYTRNCFGSLYVCLLRLNTADPRLLLLLLLSQRLISRNAGTQECRRAKLLLPLQVGTMLTRKMMNGLPNSSNASDMVAAFLRFQLLQTHLQMALPILSQPIQHNERKRNECWAVL